MPSYPERFLTDDETVVLALRPHWRVLLAPAFWFVLTAGAMIAAFVYLPDDAPSWVRVAVTLLSLLFFAGLGVPPLIRRQFTLYALTTERIVVRSGVLTRSSKEIPVESISNVVCSQRVIERMLGYGDVLLESSGETSATRLQDVPDPEQFQSRVYAVREERTTQLSHGGSSTSRDRASQLAELADLHDRGKLSDDEYAAAKARLLGED